MDSISADPNVTVSMAASLVPPVGRQLVRTRPYYLIPHYEGALPREHQGGTKSEGALGAQIPSIPTDNPHTLTKDTKSHRGAGEYGWGREGALRCQATKSPAPPPLKVASPTVAKGRNTVFLVVA